jgi:dienelactone hydrolase
VSPGCSLQQLTVCSLPLCLLATQPANSGKFSAGEMASLRAAMSSVMGRYNIDRRRVALAGFSDGATVAVSLLPLGAIAQRIIAWSPGGFAPPLVVRVARGCLP